MMSRWESFDGGKVSKWEPVDAGTTVELIELHLSSTDDSYLHGTPFQQWLAFFNIEELFPQPEPYIFSLDPNVFSDENVKKALMVMKTIVDDDLVRQEYLDSAADETGMEYQLLQAVYSAEKEKNEKEEAMEREENERKEKEEAMKRKENERKEKEKAMKRGDELNGLLQARNNEIRELREALSKFMPPAKKK